MARGQTVWHLQNVALPWPASFSTRTTSSPHRRRATSANALSSDSSIFMRTPLSDPTSSLGDALHVIKMTT